MRIYDKIAFENSSKLVHMAPATEIKRIEPKRDVEFKRFTKHNMSSSAEKKCHRQPGAAKHCKAY